MTSFDHSVSAGDGTRYAKVVFKVAEEPIRSESMWAEALPDGSYRLKNVPGWVSGLSLDDVFAAREHGSELWFEKVRSRGGHSTYRIAYQDPLGAPAQPAELDSLALLGCGYERVGQRLIALDVPAATDVYAVYQLLEDGMARGLWWFDEMHFGHARRP